MDAPPWKCHDFLVGMQTFYVYKKTHVQKCSLTLWSSEAIIVPHQIIRSWYTGRWWVVCYIWYSDEGPGRAGAQPSPFLAVPNVTARLLTATVPITVLMYIGLLLCSFSVPIEGYYDSQVLNNRLACYTRPRSRPTPAQLIVICTVWLPII